MAFQCLCLHSIVVFKGIILNVFEWAAIFPRAIPTDGVLLYSMIRTAQ